MAGDVGVAGVIETGCWADRWFLRAVYEAWFVERFGERRRGQLIGGIEAVLQWLHVESEMRKQRR